MSKKTLHLTIKKKWFDMIKSGEKREEYREAKPYWEKRLCDGDRLTPKHYDSIIFVNGYGRRAPRIEVEYMGLSFTGECRKEWGYSLGTYVIKLGRRIG